MRLARITMRAMKGRPKDTRLLCSVIALAFLFIVASMILVSSLEKTEYEQRASLYGKWQLMYYGVKEDAVRAFREKSHETVAVASFVGQSDAFGLVASFDQKLADFAGFRLKEGHMPVGGDEIVLVDSDQARGLQVGDEITVTYTYDHIFRPIDQSTEEAYRWFHPYLDLSPENKALFEAWWAGEARFLQEDLAYPASAEQLTPEQYKTAMTIWTLITSPDFATAEVTHYDNLLFGYEGMQLTVQSIYGEATFMGPGFGEDVGKAIRSQTNYNKLIVRRTYTLSGILENYAVRWDADGYEMPGAFVTQAEAQTMEAAVFSVQERMPELAPYEPRSMLLFCDPHQTAEAVFQKHLSVYMETTRDQYQVKLYKQDMLGEFGGYVVGIDEESGEKVRAPFYGRDNTVIIEYRGVTSRSTLSALRDGSVEIAHLLPPALSGETPAAYPAGDSPYRVNSFTYPFDQGTAYATLRLFMMIGLFVITQFAVFHIFFAQMKRRIRRIALMKAIGAENGQIVGMLLWEGVFLLWIALPVGTLLGAGLSYMAVRLIGASSQIRFSVDAGPVLAGIACVITAVLIGMTVSILQAVRVPLTGSLENGPVRLIPRVFRRKKKPRRQSLASITLRNLAANKGRTAVNFVLSVLLLFSMLAALFLGHHAFSRYRKDVEKTDHPDYLIRFPYALSARYLGEVLAQLSANPGLERIVPYIAGENVVLHGGELLGEGGSELLRLELSVSPADQEGSRFLTLEGETVCRTDLFGIGGDSGDLLNRLEAALTEGTIDRGKFADGEECILLVPLYNGEDGLRTSMAGSDRFAYEADTGVKVGDTLRLTGESQKLVGETLKVSSEHAQIRVAAIIRYFPEVGVYPFASGARSYTLVTGQSFISKLYPYAGRRMDAYETRLFEVMSSLHYPDCYGKTYLYVYAGQDADGAQADLAVYEAADSVGAAVENYRMENRMLYREAFNNMLMLALLGAAVALIVLSILANAVESVLQHERKRTGILQSFGVTKGRLVGIQAVYALANALLAVLAANLIAAGVMLVTTLAQSDVRLTFAQSLRVLLDSTLWRYPWTLHALICAAFLPVSLLIHTIPMARISDASAIDNIRG